MTSVAQLSVETASPRKFQIEKTAEQKYFSTWHFLQPIMAMENGA